MLGMVMPSNLIWDQGVACSNHATPTIASSPRHPGRRRGPMSLAGETRIVTAVVVAPPPRGQLGRHTDIIVVVDVAGQRLKWVPRDLWSPLIGDRVNAAFAMAAAACCGCGTGIHGAERDLPPARRERGRACSSRRQRADPHAA
ncbi:hypothetical protein MPL3356_390139 [Mesorhizobium plurifarium]|uniref:Uncharacterized protein n=1 Tax=Mesorhizobium plurifarium TaxID=69974 RepID=A0A090E4K9_MESPL|nr:hypothetical protein MPL3356_390139 [Mesorhizobium plurifarium]